MQIQRYRSLGDVLSDARTNLLAAGYSGVSCRTERVYFPGIDPNTGKNYYEQNICDAPGFTGGIDADLAAYSANTNNRGYGVDLAAERAYNIRQGGGDDQSYFQTFGNAPNIQVLNSLLADGSRVTGNSAAPVAQQYQTQFDAASAKNAIIDIKPQTQTPAKAAKGTNPLGDATKDESNSFDLGNAFSDINPMFLVAGAAVVAFLVLKK